MVTDCKGDGLKGNCKPIMCFIDNYLIGNVTRKCGHNNEWLPAKIYCIREQISIEFDKVCLTHKL